MLRIFLEEGGVGRSGRGERIGGVSGVWLSEDLIFPHIGFLLKPLSEDLIFPTSGPY